MSQERTEALHRFEQKLREQGADGFADGPRPWERWDESGHQANNRIWEGSSRRIYPGSRRAHSLEHRLLSVLAFLALSTLLVGIGGVYFSHTQTQQLATTTVQPLPFADPPQPETATAETVMVAASSRAHELNELSAPAAGGRSMQQQNQPAVVTATADITRSPESNASAANTTMALPPPPAPETMLPEATAAAAVEIAAADIDQSQQRDDTSAHSAMAMPPLPAPELSSAETTGTVDSVSIETIVTEESVTTTVYTRNPQQADAEVVAAIETTPPPFAQQMLAWEAPDSTVSPRLPNEPQQSSKAAAEASAANLERLPTPPPTALEAAAETQADRPTAEQAEVTTTIAVADSNSEGTTPESLAELEVDVTEGQHAALPDTPAAAEAEVAPMIVTAADSGTETTAEESPADVVAAPPPAAEVEYITPVETVAKTGNWVINLASYTRESTANRKLALFQQQGVDAEVFAVEINGKPMYRIRLAGFQSRRAAQAEVKPVEQLLGLEGVWVSKR